MSTFPPLKILLKNLKHVDTIRTSLSWSHIKKLHLCKYLESNTPSISSKKFSLYSNPADRLQPFTQVPIIPEDQKGFRPTEEEVANGTDMFVNQSLNGQLFEFIGAYPNPHVMPKRNTPEVCFIGKSNVGKSSLLSTMFSGNSIEIRNISSQPGSTRNITMFGLGGRVNCVDMPGYGFNMPKHYDYSVEAYMTARRSVMNFFLVDGSHGMNKTDMKYFFKYAELGLPLTVVLTKIDLPKPKSLARTIERVLTFHDMYKADNCNPQPFLVSSKTGEGVALLQAYIASITGNLTTINLRDSE